MVELFNNWNFEMIEFKIELRGAYVDFTGEVKNNSGTDLCFLSFDLNLFDEAGICCKCLPLVFHNIPSGYTKPFRETIFNAPFREYRYQLKFKEGY